MWWFKKTTRPRRSEGRKADTGETAWQRFRHAGGVGAILVAIGFFVGVVAMDVFPLDPLTYRQGQYIDRDIYTRVSFNRLSQPKLAALEKRARDSEPATFRLDPAAARIITQVDSFADRAGVATQPTDLTQADQWKIDSQSLEAWRQYLQTDRAGFEQSLKTLGEQLLQAPIVSHDEIITHDNVIAQQRESSEKIRLVFDGQQSVISAGELTDITRPQDVASRARQLAAGFPAGPVRDSVDAYLQHTLAASPTYMLDEVGTQRDKDRAAALVRANPPQEAYEAYGKGRVLVTAGQQLSAQDLELLSAENEASLSSERAASPWRTWQRIAGRAGILLLITSLLCAYVAKSDPQIVRETWRAFVVAAILLVMLAINKTIVLGDWDERVALLTVMFAAVTLAIGYSQRFALVMAAFLSLLTVFQLRADIWQLIILMIGAASAVLQLGEIRSRTKLIRVGLFSASAVAVTVLAASSALLVPWDIAVPNAAWAGAMALLVGVLAQGILPLIERLFNVATSMTLLEWCDTDKPLLKRLRMEAPGTFNHSLQLGAMCEEAAEAIGVRGLLARAGAYYHDIGKINKPEYFVENQFGAPSKHAKLSPAMSLLIIIGHVKDGLAMAREYGLPPVLREFIASHHGTTLVQYFYNAAAEQRKAESERAPDEVEFRYPGPKPHSKEVAILMLADAAESSVRSMSDPTPGRIENQVHSMVMRRLMDGQMDECDLTLNQVHAIETSLIKSLCGIYHSRVAYPTPAGQKPSAAELSALRKAEQLRLVQQAQQAAQAARVAQETSPQTETKPAVPTDRPE